MITASVILVASAMTTDNKTAICNVNDCHKIQDASCIYWHEAVSQGKLWCTTVENARNNCRLKTKDRYILFIAMYHNMIATVRTGNSLVNYWKRVRAQLLEGASVDEEPEIKLLVFILIIVL